MRWQFGGNFQPIRMICEFDWRECPTAIINYVWSEIVTDVVECLTNEWMMWRVIAMLFVCTLLIHTIYSKAKLVDETTTNRDNLNVVGCKVQDLELKVNILTYKMQYGTWPLPRQIRGSGVERELRNVRLTLTNSNDRNAWLKHMLLSPTENATCVPYAKIGPRSVRCLTKLINLETKYMSSRFGRDASPLSQKERHSSSSERSMKYATRESKRSLVVTEDAKKDAKSENLGVRRESSAARGCAKRPTSWSETGVSKCRESSRTPTRNSQDTCNDKRTSRKSSRRDETPEERVNATSETLQEVRKKLDELHNVLRIYGSASGGNEQAGATNKHLAETILRDLKNIGDDLPESESDSKPRESLRHAEEEPKDIPVKEHEETTSEFEQCRSDFSSSSEIEKIRITEEPEIAKIPEKGKSSSSLSTKDGPSQTDPPNDQLEKSTSDEMCSVLEEMASPISSTAETSRDSDTDERSNAILLREALKFRNALVSRLELESSDHVAVEAADEASRTKLAFQPKFLDIISEEHSAGSSTEKSTRAREFLGIGKSPTTCREAASSALALASSSEYFSLSSIDLKAIVPRGEDDHEEANLHDDLSDLVNRSVRNIRDYVEAFSRFQNDAIAETRRAINDENARVSLNEISPRESVDSITRFVNTLAITISEELPRELSEPAISRLARLENSDEDSHETSGCTRDFELERRPGTISLTDKSDLTLEEGPGSRVYDTIHETVDSDEASLSSEPSCKQSLRDYSEGTTSDSIEPSRYVDTSLAIIEDVNSARQEQDASRILDSPLTGRTVIRATGSSIDNLGLSTSLESFDETKNPRNDDTQEVNLRDEFQTQQSNVVQETSSLYFTDQASFPDIETKFFDIPDERLSGIESNASIFDDTDLSYEKPEVRTYNENLVDRPEVELKFENDAELEVELNSEASSELEVQFEYENGGKPEVEAERLAVQAEVIEAPVRSQIESLVGKSKVSGSDGSNEKPEMHAKHENMPENSDLRRESKKSNVIPEVRRECEIFLNEKPEVHADHENLPKDWNLRREDKNRSVATEVRRERERILTEKPEVPPKRDSLNTPTGGRETSPENSTSCVAPGANSVPSETNLHQIGSNLSVEPSGIYVDASSREFFNTSGTCKSARGPCSSPLQQQQRSITRMLPRRGSSLDIVERSTKRPERSSKNREKIGKTCGQSAKWTDITIGEASGSGLELPKRRSRSYATPRKSENFPSGRDDVPESNETRRLVGIRKNLEAGKCQKKNEKSGSPVRCASSDPSPRNNCIDGNAEEAKPETSRSESGTRPRTTGSKPRASGRRPSGNGSQAFATESSSAASSSNTSKNRVAKETRRDEADGETAIKSERSTLGKNISRSCIPVLRSRLEAVRGHEKRAKSPARCPLTMSTSSWNQENRSAGVSSILVDPKTEGSHANENCPNESKRDEDRCSTNDTEKLPDRRTVIYVNIVTEREQKSATRIVDPKKFLEYLKDRELKIQSVQDEVAKDNRSEIGANSPRILTVVSSAVDERMNDGGAAPRGSWSLRVERREIEVSAKPSVIDTSTSISDLPETQSLVLEHPKFQIFEVPKELTKDEYIVLLETLNRDPNLEQLREMHNLCDKLGLGFNE